MFLKQSTAYTFRLGPFLDSTDGNTQENALTIAYTDVLLSKAGGALAAKSETTALTGTGVNAHYTCVLNTTDTGTLGNLRVWCHVAGALSVWKDFLVLPANIYDSFVSGTDLIDVNTAQVGGVAQTAGDIPAMVTAVDDFVDTEVAAIKAKTDNLPLAPAAVGDIPTVIQIRTEMDTNSVDLNTIITYVDELESRLTATRAGYLDNLSGGAVALAATCTAARLAELDAINLPTDIAGVQTDTNDIQTRLPAALTADGNMKSDALRINGSAAAAAQLAKSAAVIVSGTAIAGTLSTTQMTTDLTEATNEHFNGRIIIWTSGVLLYQATNITAYDGTTKMLTYIATTEAPTAGDTFIIV